MIKRKQLYRHRPEDEIFGDCHRTAIACLLDKEPWEVPHFAHLWATTPGYSWRDHEREYLRSQGYGKAEFCFDSLDQSMKFMESWNGNLLYILGGTSPRGTEHSVICRGGEFYWDPAKDGGFLIGPLSSKLYEATILVPISMICNPPVALT